MQCRLIATARNQVLQEKWAGPGAPGGRGWGSEQRLCLRWQVAVTHTAHVQIHCWPEACFSASRPGGIIAGLPEMCGRWREAPYKDMGEVY